MYITWSCLNKIKPVSWVSLKNSRKQTYCELPYFRRLLLLLFYEESIHSNASLFLVDYNKIKFYRKKSLPILYFFFKKKNYLCNVRGYKSSFCSYINVRSSCKKQTFNKNLMFVYIYLTSKIYNYTMFHKPDIRHKKNLYILAVFMKLSSSDFCFYSASIISVLLGIKPKKYKNILFRSLGAHNYVNSDLTFIYDSIKSKEEYNSYSHDSKNIPDYIKAAVIKIKKVIFDSNNKEVIQVLEQKFKHFSKLDLTSDPRVAFISWYKCKVKAQKNFFQKKIFHTSFKYSTVKLYNALVRSKISFNSKINKKKSLLLNLPVDTSKQFEAYALKSTILFLRKNKIFNKGRYSRNRQLYRTGVYWCLWFNVVSLFGLYLYFYRFTFNYGYIYTPLLMLILTLFGSKIVRYRFYNPFYIINETVSFYDLIKELISVIVYKKKFSKNMKSYQEYRKIAIKLKNEKDKSKTL